MTSIIKVDQIQNAAGGVPTAGDLGLNVSGSVLQVKQGAPVGNLDFNQSLTIGATIYTGPTITPTSTSSKILVMAQHSTELATGSSGSTSGSSYIYTSIYEGNTALASNGQTGSIANAHGYYVPVNMRQHGSGSLLYSPNTTSPLTFYIKCHGGTNVGGVRWLFYGCAITVMEIAG